MRNDHLGPNGKMVTFMSSESSTESGRSSGSLSTSVLERALVGDQDAFRKITDLFSGLVYCWCRKKGLSEEDAKDTSQEVFKTVAIKLGLFRREAPSDSFRAWIRSVTRNKIADHYRGAETHIKASHGQGVEIAEIPDKCWNIELEDDPVRETTELFQRAVQLIRQEFSERDFQAFWRVAVNGMSAKDVATELGMTPNAVFIVISRIKKRVREEFGDLIEVKEADHGR
jgi:RNA polymerase sigma-70 factor, ECF subfamily